MRTFRCCIFKCLSQLSNLVFIFCFCFKPLQTFIVEILCSLELLLFHCIFFFFLSSYMDFQQIVFLFVNLLQCRGVTEGSEGQKHAQILVRTQVWDVKNEATMNHFKGLSWMGCFYVVR